jgi:hypothetical protein
MEKNFQIGDEEQKKTMTYTRYHTINKYATTKNSVLEKQHFGAYEFQPKI